MTVISNIIAGTKFPSPIGLADGLGNETLGDISLFRGAPISVLNKAALEAWPAKRRMPGQLGYVRESGRYFELQNDLVTWAESTLKKKSSKAIEFISVATLEEMVMDAVELENSTNAHYIVIDTSPEPGNQTKAYRCNANIAAFVEGNFDFNNYKEYFNEIPGTFELPTDLLTEADLGTRIARFEHGHAISEVSGLQAILNGKSDLGHIHVIADVSGLQVALDSKQATITGGASTITGTNLTANRALISNGSGKVAVAAVTNVELGYLTGVTSAVQTQLNGKSNTGHGHSISEITGLQLALDGKSNISHTHGISEVTGLQLALDGKSNTGHSHAIADVTGLQTALNGKSNTGHTHAISEVTGLQSALDSKSNTGHLHDDRYSLLSHQHDSRYFRGFGTPNNPDDMRLNLGITQGRPFATNHPATTGYTGGHGTLLNFTGGEAASISTQIQMFIDENNELLIRRNSWDNIWSTWRRVWTNGNHLHRSDTENDARYSLGTHSHDERYSLGSHLHDERYIRYDASRFYELSEQLTARTNIKAVGYSTGFTSPGRFVATASSSNNTVAQNDVLKVVENLPLNLQVIQVNRNTSGIYGADGPTFSVTGASLDNGVLLAEFGSTRSIIDIIRVRGENNDQVRLIDLRARTAASPPTEALVFSVTGTGVIRMLNALTVPSGNIANTGQFYAQNGLPMWRDPSGIVFNLTAGGLTEATADTRYLRLTGGNLTGSLSINSGNLFVNAGGHFRIGDPVIAAATAPYQSRNSVANNWANMFSMVHSSARTFGFQVHADQRFAITDFDANVLRLVIDGTGNVSIGTPNSANWRLLVQDNRSGNYVTTISNQSTSGNGLQVYAGSTSAHTVARFVNAQDGGAFSILGNGAVSINAADINTANPPGTSTAIMVHLNGSMRASGDYHSTSDARVKTNIRVIENALEKLSKIRGVYYNRIDINEEDRNKLHVGVIAQEVKEVLPEVVGGETFYSVEYGKMTALLIEAIKELNAKVAMLERRAA
jgi:hypothetical protein